MRALLYIFFIFCFIGPAIAGANWRTIAEQKRVETMLMSGDIKDLTLKELTEIKI